MSELNNESIDLDNFDLNFEEVAAPAGFDLPPEGMYRGTLSWKVKKLTPASPPSLEETFRVSDIIELVDPTLADKVTDKSKFNTLTGLTEDKAGYLKVRAGILASALGTGAGLKDLLEVVQEVNVEFFLKHRKGTGENADKVYAKVLDEGFKVV